MGPAHGPERHPARVRLGAAASAVEGARQPFRGLRRRTGADHAAAEQHRDRADDRLVCGEGLVGLVPALAILLGANVGTTLIVQLLSFNVSAVAPVLFIIGVVAFRSGARSRIKDLGRVSIGLGLVLLALHILLDTLAPAENAPEIRLAARRHHRRSGAVHPARGRSDLGRAFERRHRAADHVAGLLAIHHARRRARPGARRQSRQCDQSGDRGRTPRRYGELPAAGGKPAQPAGRRRSGRTVPARPGRGLARISAPHGENDGGIPRGLQRRAGARFHRAARPARLAAGEDISGAQEERRSRGAALSRRERARDALARAGRRGARDAAHGRHRRGDAAASDDGADDQRSRAGARGLAHGQRRRQARRGDQALRDQADARQPRRAGRRPRHGDHLVRDQPRARRRHHRQEPVRARRQEDQAQAAILSQGAEELRAFHKRIVESLCIALSVFMSRRCRARRAS